MRERSNRPGRAYAAIPNAAMRDTSISIEARGLLALLMTYSDDWEFRKDHLMEKSCMGRDKFERAMRELRDAQYVGLVFHRDAKGRVDGTTWVIRDQGNRSPEKPGFGEATEALKNRDPAKPTPGETAPIRRSISEEDQKEETQTLFGDIQEKKAEKKPDRFSDFWNTYPKKAGKEAALKAWEKATKKTDPEKIIAAARVYAGSDGVLRGFVKYPQGWLNDGRFNDPDLQPAQTGASKPYRYVHGGIER